MCAVGMSRAVQGKVVPSLIFLKESVPVSSYQQAGIPVDLKRKIARLGIDMLLKMVSSWAWRGCSGPACGPIACGKWWDPAQLHWVEGKPSVESALETAEPAKIAIHSIALLSTFSVACALLLCKVLWEGWGTRPRPSPSCLQTA